MVYAAPTAQEPYLLEKHLLCHLVKYATLPRKIITYFLLNLATWGGLTIKNRP